MPRGQLTPAQDGTVTRPLTAELGSSPDHRPVPRQAALGPACMGGGRHAGCSTAGPHRL